MARKGAKMSAAILMVLLISSGETQPTGTLLVNAVGFENDDGAAAVAVLSRDEWSFPPDPSMAEIYEETEISDLAANFEITDIPLGEYVVMVFHDSNGNGRFDHAEEFLGVSGELPQMSSRREPPDFDQLSIQLSGSVSSARITVRERMRSGGNTGSGPPGGRPGGGPR